MMTIKFSAGDVQHIVADVYGGAAFTAERGSKEIDIRKVLVQADHHQLVDILGSRA